MGGQALRRALRQLPVAALAALLAAWLPARSEDPAAGARASMEATGAARAQEARGWLDLGQDQREARARAAPLTPLQSQQLQTRELRERVQLMGTVQGQQREIDALGQSERRDAGLGRSVPGREAQAQGLLMRQGQELEALRLRQGLERRMLGSPGGGFGRP